MGLRKRTLRPLQCTAEHLCARSDGGRDTQANVAAACWLCNQRRHKRKVPLAPTAYRAFVQKRLSNGRWHPAAIVRHAPHAVPRLDRS
ncbi:MAG: HNH endonuclease [Xanthomonadaceae bacterium]|nr:HNH endonuclease [Xanthomonadaceae bacterium]